MINILGAIAWSRIMRYIRRDRIAYRNENRPDENMNITGVKGLTDAEIATLKA
jgi:hypothetical protein